MLESGWQQPEAASDDVCTGGNGAIKTESNSTPNDKRVDLQESLQSIFKVSSLQSCYVSDLVCDVG